MNFALQIEILVFDSSLNKLTENKLFYVVMIKINSTYNDKFTLF
jgi:hypothetical protein